MGMFVLAAIMKFTIMKLLGLNVTKTYFNRKMQKWNADERFVLNLNSGKSEEARVMKEVKKKRE